jgi:hypothetical protein
MPLEDLRIALRTFIEGVFPECIMTYGGDDEPRLGHFNIFITHEVDSLPFKFWFFVSGNKIACKSSGRNSTYLPGADSCIVEIENPEAFSTLRKYLEDNVKIL